MRTGEFSHNGTTLYYEMLGDGDKDVVLQHGFSDFTGCWGPLPGLLVERGYRVAMMDARGHGRSAKPEDGYDLTTFTSDMMGMVDHLKLNQPVIVGHSMGGSMATRAAGSYPDLLRAAVLIDPVFRDLDENQKLAIIETRRDAYRALKRMSHGEILAETRRKHPEWDDVYIKAGALGKVYLSMDIFQVYKTFDVGWREDLANAICPLMLVTADPELGAIVLPETAEWITKKHKNVEVSHISGVGHNIHREAEEQVRKLIFAFLDRQF